jgi:mono/diheme cytochrome c family protein
MRWPLRRILKWGVLGVLALLLLIQLVPYGRDHSNPKGGRPIAWDSPRTKKLMTGACMDCHSNDTQWPWYSNVAPSSWLVQHDVEDGRSRLNLSTGQGEVGEMTEAIREGDMPPWQYKVVHSGARLSDREKQDLIHGIQATFGP